MGIPIDINDLPPDAIVEDTWSEDDLTAEDCGFDDEDVPIEAYENHEETIIADTVDSPTIEQDMSDLLCTIIPNGGLVYGFILTRPGNYDVYRYLDNDETDDEKRWELRPNGLQVTGNTSIEIAFNQAIGKDWKTLGLKSNLDNTLIVIGVMPKGE